MKHSIAVLGWIAATNVLVAGCNTETRGPNPVGEVEEALRDEEAARQRALDILSKDYSLQPGETAEAKSLDALVHSFKGANRAVGYFGPEWKPVAAWSPHRAGTLTTEFFEISTEIWRIEWVTFGRLQECDIWVQDQNGNDVDSIEAKECGFKLMKGPGLFRMGMATFSDRCMVSVHQVAQTPHSTPQF